jgi:endoglucanase
MKFTLAPLFLSALAAAKVCYVGVNESGGEFGVWSATSTKGTGLPGTLNKEYAFINKATIDTWISVNKINTFRVAFLLERMCPPATGLGKTFSSTVMTLCRSRSDNS